MSSPLTEDLCFSPDDYDDNPDQEDEDGGPNHKKRKQVKRACFSCRKAHARTHTLAPPHIPHSHFISINRLRVVIIGPTEISRNESLHGSHFSVGHSQ
jgi:hypothetical protein